MDIGLMVEGQNGLTWERWSHILALAERLGFPSVFRSDHYFIGAEQQSLEAYLSFVIAAKESKNLRFGPMVTPVTFREPVNVARMAAQIDVLSGGRFVMGLGAGWNEAEHKAYGLHFPTMKERFDRLEEAIQVSRAMWGAGPANFDGRYYRLDGANPMPKPEGGRPPLLIGGGGEKRTLQLVARYADEWNAINLGPEGFSAKIEALARHCEAERRDPATIRKSMMAFGIIGPTEAHLDRATSRVQTMFRAEGSEPRAFRETLKGRGFFVGTTSEVVDRLGELAALGLGEVQFQHMDYDSDDIPEYLAAEIAPRVKPL